MAMKQSKADDLVDRWVELDPWRPGSAQARLKDYGIHIWALIGHLPAARGDIRVVAEDYQIPVEAVEAALAYYTRHRGAIDAKLEANAAYVDWQSPAG
jgi:uncharacterized protein (DUF433 family)